jgi:hypothetical protein
VPNIKKKPTSLWKKIVKVSNYHNLDELRIIVNYGISSVKTKILEFNELPFEMMTEEEVNQESYSIKNLYNNIKDMIFDMRKQYPPGNQSDTEWFDNVNESFKEIDAMIIRYLDKPLNIRKFFKL